MKWKSDLIILSALYCFKEFQTVKNCMDFSTICVRMGKKNAGFVFPVFNMSQMKQKDCFPANYRSSAYRGSGMLCRLSYYLSFLTVYHYVVHYFNIYYLSCPFIFTLGFLLKFQSMHLVSLYSTVIYQTNF